MSSRSNLSGQKKKQNTEQRVGAGQMRIAIAGRTSIGGKMTPEDRRKLLHSAGENITRGNAKAARSTAKSKSTAKSAKRGKK